MAQQTTQPERKANSSGDVLYIALVKNLCHVVDVTVVDKLHSDHPPVIMRTGNEPNEPTPTQSQPWTGRNSSSTSKVILVSLTRSNSELRESYPSLHLRSLSSTPCAAIQTAHVIPAYPEPYQEKEQSETTLTTNRRNSRPDCSEPPPMGSPESTDQS